MAGSRVPRLHHPRHPHPQTPGRRFITRWFLTNSVISGVLALCWLLLRSGSKPSRLAYPCQQAAVSMATLAFSAPLASALIVIRRRLTAGLRTPPGMMLAALGLLATLGIWGYLSRASEYQGPRLDPPPGYRAKIYHVMFCPRDPVGDHFLGLDNLITLMGREGLKFYESPAVSPEAGPDGIISSDDVVIIKINYQWPARGGTNTDLLRGLIHRILDHPDTYTGEIVVCENTQVIPVDDFDRPNNNAQDPSLSPLDVVSGFQSQGYQVSLYDWGSVRNISVGEYADGDTNDGYVVYPYDSLLHGAVSYPKFQTAFGTMISSRDGIWDPNTATYDRDRLKFINVPVLKSHHGTYGATVCVKNYMGVVTNLLSTNSHNAIEYGILGALLGEIRPADLNILDCIWIQAHPDDGPMCSYSAATRRDELVASVDPVATDIWAVTNILVPGFLDNQYTPPWPEPSADPTDPSSDFRVYLDNSMYWILNAGFDVTNNLADINAVSWVGVDEDDDCNGNGVVDLEDIAAGTSQDCTDNWIPDECEPDCNGNGEADTCDVADGTSPDYNQNGLPDECEDCNGNGVQDNWDIAGGTSPNCNENLFPDECDIAAGTSQDIDGSGVPDECEAIADCNGNGIPDHLEGSAVLFNNLGTESSALDTSAPVSQDIHWGAHAKLDRLTVYYRSTGSSPGFMTVRFFDGGAGGSMLPVYPDGLIAEFELGELDLTYGALDFRTTHIAPPLWLPADIWMEVEIDRDAGVELASGPGDAAFTQGLVYDRNASELLPGPLYLQVRLLGLLCSSDCNDNGIEDACDIACGPVGGPCDVSGCGQSTDDNDNGVPDECDPCGDLDGDGSVGSSDYDIFVGAFGHGLGDPAYVAAADFDDDGFIGLDDYQAWLACYRAFINNPLAPAPGRRHVPAPRRHIDSANARTLMPPEQAQ